MQLVPATVPTRKVAMLERIKASHRPEGMLQCPRCGCRAMVTETVGAVVKNEKIQGGEVVAKNICAACYMRGIHLPMMPNITGV